MASLRLIVLSVHRLPLLLFALLLLPASLPGVEKNLVRPTAIMMAAQERITSFHHAEQPSGAVLRVVYFHPLDRAPLPDHVARLERIMTDVSGFYRDGLYRLGFKGDGLPLERSNGQLVIHPVQGLHPALHYQHESGREIWAEVRNAVGNKFDPDREHVLMLHGLCHREPDGRYVFNAPYYGAGWSDHRRGLCHAADCELLDPLLLTKKNERMVFTEHYYARKEMSVAQFNTWYLGGIAHELGHGLGFPHDTGGPNEAPGFALMGVGNHHYRENVWGARRPAYLSLATALRLAAHPLVTQSNKSRWQEPDAVFTDLKAESKQHVLRISGRVIASVPPCAVIASVWPASATTDHRAMTFCAIVADDGSFSVELTDLRGAAWNMNLGCVLVNGAESVLPLPFGTNRRGEPDAERLIATWKADVTK
jgi:hypothetical protein